MKSADHRKYRDTVPAFLNGLEHIRRAAVEAAADKYKSVRLALFREDDRKALVGKIERHLLFFVLAERKICLIGIDVLVLEILAAREIKSLADLGKAVE